MTKKSPTKGKATRPRPPDPIHVRFSWKFAYENGEEMPLNEIMKNLMAFVEFNQYAQSEFTQPPRKDTLESEQCTYMAVCADECREAHRVLESALKTGDGIECARAGFGFGRAFDAYEAACSFESLRFGIETKRGQRRSAEVRKGKKEERGSQQERELIAEWKLSSRPTALGVAKSVEGKHMRNVKDVATGRTRGVPRKGWDCETLRKMIPALHKEGKLSSGN